MNFLTGLGDLAGSFAPYLSQYADQRKEDSISRDIGMAAMQQAGIPLPPQQQGGLSGLLSGLSGGQGMGSLALPPPAQQQAMPTPRQPPTGNVRSPLASTQPMVAQPGGGPPSPQPTPQPTQAPSGGTAALQTQQSLGARQPPQQQARPQGQEPGSGQFSPQQLISSLMRLPNMTPEHVGAALGSKQFERLLNMEGLQQWRAIRGALGIDQAERGWAGLEEKKNEFSRRQGSLDKYRDTLTSSRTRMQQLGPAQRAIFQSAAQKAAQIGDAQRNGDIDPKEAAKQLEAVDRERDKALDEAQKKFAPDVPAYDEGGSGGGNAGGTSKEEAVQQAKAAITAGKPRDKIIERLKQHFPDADTSGL